MPSGWSSGAGFITKQGLAVIGMSVWDVSEVPRDPCLWTSTMTRPGPSVDDLVAAIDAQRTRNATQPVDVTIDGRSAVRIEWSVPEDAVVTGDADFAGCDRWPDNGHADFVSWLSPGGGERYQQVAGQIDRLWILAVDGQRVVIDATFSPDATNRDVRQLMRLVESLRFEAP